jgi:hypothetical protein
MGVGVGVEIGSMGLAVVMANQDSSAVDFQQAFAW